MTIGRKPESNRLLHSPLPETLQAESTRPQLGTFTLRSQPEPRSANNPVVVRPNRVYIGIDNGFTGAMVRLDPQDQILAFPVRVTDLGRHRVLDVTGCASLLDGLINTAGVPRDDVVVVFEQTPKNPLFGAKNNYTNGQNNEFWRVILTLHRGPFLWVDPIVWQRHIFASVRGTDTKAKAALVCEQRFPNFRPGATNRAQNEGIIDGLCIALWARETGK